MLHIKFKNFGDKENFKKIEILLKNKLINYDNFLKKINKIN